MKSLLSGTWAPHWLTLPDGIILFGPPGCWWCWLHMSPFSRPDIPPRRSWRGSAGCCRGSGVRWGSSLGSEGLWGSPQAFQSSFFGTHCWECCGGPAGHCCGGGAPVQTLADSEVSSSSPQVPPIFVVGVWPQGVFVAGWGGGWPPFLRFASQRSVPRKAPLLTFGFQAGCPPAADGSTLAPGSGDPGTSQLVSWLTCC